MYFTTTTTGTTTTTAATFITSTTTTAIIAIPLRLPGFQCPKSQIRVSVPKVSTIMAAASTTGSVGA